MNASPNPPGHGGDSITFLSFRLDRRAARLIDGDRAIELRPKTWAVLVHLAERPDMLVTQEELLDAVWPNVAVTPGTLTKSIGEIRAALGDDARSPRCIETVHGRGFRFIARITNETAGDAIPDRHGRNTRPFVGRETEIRCLSELFSRACAGERQMVFVTGPAGMGKSALVDAFLDSPVLRDAASPVWIARGASVEQHGTREAYMPVLDALEGLARRPDAERLIRLLRRNAPTWLVQMPWLLGEDAETARAALHNARPERMLRELASLTESLTSETTLVLVLEDLHWSDPSTVDALSFLAQRSEPARLLIIGTYRPADVAVHEHVLALAVRTLKARRRCTEVPLHDLSERELQEYLDRRFPGADFPAALAKRIHQYTKGTPLFMISVVQHELLRGRILETNPGWALSVPLERLALEVPDDVGQMITMDFGSLSPSDRALLEAASVAGCEFAVPAVATALESNVEDAEARCEALARAQWFLRAAGSAEWPDGRLVQCYAFNHELHRNVAYAEIPAGRRRRLHQRIGEALEAAYGDRVSEIAPALAIHFEQSHDCMRVVRYRAAAATLALRRFANREAISNVEDALAWVARLPDTRERLCQELGLRLALASPLSEVHGFASEPLRENCERAYEICVEVGSPTQLAHILYSLVHLYWQRSDKLRAPDALAKLDELAARLGSTETRFVVDTALVRTAFHSGHFLEACRLAEARLPASHYSASTGVPFAHGPHPLISANCHTALALWMLGHLRRARELMQASLAAARESGLPATLMAATCLASILEVLERNPTEACRLAEQTLTLSAEHGLEYWGVMASVFKAWGLVELGQVREGIELLENARSALRARNVRIMSTHALASQAEAHRRIGEFEVGLGLVDQGLEAAEQTVDRSYWPELWRLKGELLLSSLDSLPRGGCTPCEEAFRYFRPALERSRALSAAGAGTRPPIRGQVARASRGNQSGAGVENAGAEARGAGAPQRHLPVVWPRG